ncbi:hypothetical protein [Pseudomonas syringae]
MPDDNADLQKYDHLSRLVEETDPLGRRITCKHHLATTLVTQTTYPDGSTWKARYDSRGNLLIETDSGSPQDRIPPAAKTACHTPSSMRPTSPNTCGGTAWHKWCASRTAPGKDTHYRYDDRGHLIAVTDALNTTTTLERKPDGEVLRINHPDGTSENFTYNALGQVVSHTNGQRADHPAVTQRPWFADPT